MPRRSILEAVKWFVFRHFEHVLVAVLVASMLAIHWLVDYKIAFLNFYYLPIIMAGFFLGRVMAVWGAVFIVSLVVFFQAVEGLTGAPGFPEEVVFALAPWGGFLILTGYLVGRLAEQRQRTVEDLKHAYVTMLELLSYHLEAQERTQRGHSRRVAELVVRLGEALNIAADEVENTRIAALLHEIGPHDPRLMQLLDQLPGEQRSLPLAGAIKGATEILDEYRQYYEVVGEDWPVDHVKLSSGVKVLAVADAFETLQTPTEYRPAFARWTALEEIERGVGRTFATSAVKALRHIVAAPERSEGQQGRVRAFGSSA